MSKVDFKSFNQFKDFCSIEHAKLEFHVNSSSKKIYSLAGTFDNDKLMDLIHCMLLKGFGKMSASLLKNIQNNAITKVNAFQVIHETVSWLEGLLSAYKCSIDDSHYPVNISFDYIAKNPELTFCEGINLENVPNQVKELLVDIKRYAEDLKVILNIAEIKKKANSVTKLVDKVTDTDLGNLYDAFTQPGQEILHGSKSDFIAVFRGKGDNKHRIRIKKKSDLLSILLFFKRKKLIDSKDEMINWYYIRENFQLDGGMELTENDYKNLNKAKSAVCNKILEKILP